MTDLEACQQLLMRLLRREPVTAHELKRALGEEHWEDYEGRLERVKEWREEAKIASYELRDYAKTINRGWGKWEIAMFIISSARLLAKKGELVKKGDPRAMIAFDKIYEVSLKKLNERNLAHDCVVTRT